MIKFAKSSIILNKNQMCEEVIMSEKFNDPLKDKLMSLLEEETRKNFVYEVLKNQNIRFKILYEKKLEISETNARYHLKLLEKHKILLRRKKKKSKAIVLSINPIFINRLRQHFEIKTKFGYIGGIGTTKPIEQIASISNRLHRHFGNRIRTLDIFYTQTDTKKLSSSEQWQEATQAFNEVRIHTSDMYDFDKNYSVMKSVIENNITAQEILIDITGGPKIPSLALYKLSQTYGLKRYYFPEDAEDLVITLP